MAQRRVRAGSTALNPARVLALAIGPDPVPFGVPDLDDAALLPLWREHAAYILRGHPAGRRPWAWWRYEPGVPDGLRGGYPRLVVVGSDEEAGHGRAVAELEERRAAWLAEHENPGGSR